MAPQANRTFRRKQISRGLCPKCGEPKGNRFYDCKDCRIKHAAYMKMRRKNELRSYKEIN